MSRIDFDVPEDGGKTTSSKQEPKDEESGAVDEVKLTKRKPTHDEMAFSLFVRTLTQDLLDHHLPITQQSHQNLQRIEAACKREFPQFDARKLRLKIRAQLKLYRRNLKKASEKASSKGDVKAYPERQRPILPWIPSELAAAEKPREFGRDSGRIDTGVQPAEHIASATATSPNESLKRLNSFHAASVAVGDAPMLKYLIVSSPVTGGGIRMPAVNAGQPLHPGAMCDVIQTPVMNVSPLSEVSPKGHTVFTKETANAAEPSICSAKLNDISFNETSVQFNHGSDARATSHMAYSFPEGKSEKPAVAEVMPGSTGDPFTSGLEVGMTESSQIQTAIGAPSDQGSRNLLAASLRMSAGMLLQSAQLFELFGNAAMTTVASAGTSGAVSSFLHTQSPRDLNAEVSDRH